ncbi:MAG: virulence factor SrfB [Rhodospirillaceae bacterium]|nr:virulence factor SrfB [Rhodospirillaceae bacterium]
MLKALTRAYRSVVSLIPFSGVQILDFGFDIDATPKLTRFFWEEKQTDQPEDDGTIPVSLRSLHPDPETGELIDPATGQHPDEDQVYSFNKVKGLEPYLGKWVPVPVLRIKGKDADGEDVFDQGPTNWARVRVVELPERDRDGHTHRVMLAFDTEIRPTEADRPYLVPSPRDSEEEQEFRFVAREVDNGWFLSEPWVEEWLEEVLREYRVAQRAGRPLRAEDYPYLCEHWARYLTFLNVLEDACRFPRVKLADTVSEDSRYVPIDVDLVLDIGNSRTCGILIESYPDERLDLNNSYMLELRDLSRPEQAYSHPFESRVEFARPAFGRDYISRRSGRASGFYWPSIVRVGPEAARLAGEAQGTEGTSGLSSPKRYLWDNRPLNQGWRFNGIGQDGVTTEPPVTGAIMAFVTEDGDVIRNMKKPAGSAVRAKFSRSSLFTFLLSEIILQAQMMINSPDNRSQRRHADVPRQLRRIILTMPPATPLAEQRIMRERAKGAIMLTWDALGWTGRPRMPAPEPTLILQWDEASCTQLVYLYTEITQKFQGAATDFFAIMGRTRAEYGFDPSLRVASIDIGGGTTDLMVTTYQIEGNRAINPTQNFREGFKIAGDDILEAVIERHVLPPIGRHLASCGVRDAGALLQQLFGGDRAGMPEQERHLRKQFVTQVCMPIALALLHAYEGAKPYGDQVPFDMPFEDFFTLDTWPPKRITDYVERKAQEAGSDGFRVKDVTFTVNFDALAQEVQNVMRATLFDLCEVVYTLDCDILLISGRPSRLPAIQDAILALMPVSPNRIVRMHHYRVGHWYPFSDSLARIDDPKTTAVVGGMLCALSEGQIEGFLLRASQFTLKSTARYIGEMEISGQIKTERVLFSDIDLEARATADQSAAMRFYAPSFIGFRQLPVERWTATPLYYLELTNPQMAPRLSLPLTVTLERAEVEAEGTDEAKKEDFKIVEVEDAQGEARPKSLLQLRLQTLKSEAGYWLDTGILTLYKSGEEGGHG